MENQPRRRVVTPILIFGICLLIAVIMLLVALTTWISDLTGSPIWGTLIVGGFFAIVATILYFASVQETVRHIRHQIDGILHATRLVRNLYRWATEKTSTLVGSLLSALVRKL